VAFDGNQSADNIYFDGWWDNLISWQSVGPYQAVSSAQGLASFQAWMSNVLNPTLQACVGLGLYCIVTDFDFGPATLPLRFQRMQDFWGELSTSSWANHPQVLFGLWNEMEDVEGYAGFDPSSWATQKANIQAVVNLIRANGANNIIITPAPGFNAYTDAATSSPLDGSNLVYSAHQYSTYFSGNQPHLAAALASGQPVLLEEWGPGDSSSTTDAANFAATLQSMIEPSLGATTPGVGWLGWAFTDSWSPDMFSDDALSQPTQFGVVVRQWLYTMRNTNQPQ
jgi:hypothetical protein